MYKWRCSSATCWRRRRNRRGKTLQHVDDEEETEEEKPPMLTDRITHPTLRINRPLGLLKREYKHPLSMYEDILNNMYSRYVMYKARTRFTATKAGRVCHCSFQHILLSLLKALKSILLSSALIYPMSMAVSCWMTSSRCALSQARRIPIFYAAVAKTFGKLQLDLIYLWFCSRIFWSTSNTTNSLTCSMWLLLHLHAHSC